MQLVLFRQRWIQAAGNLGPIYSYHRVVPYNPTFVFRVVEVRALVGENRVFQRKKSVGEPFRNVKLIPSVCVKNDSVPFSEGGTVLPKVNGNLKKSTLNDSNKFCLRTSFLKMKTSQNPFC